LRYRNPIFATAARAWWKN